MFILKLIPARFFSKQARKPTGFVGRFIMSRMFNKGNAHLNAFILKHMAPKPTEQLLEIGFGPGKLLYDVANLVSEGHVHGIDFSEAMVARASHENERFIQDGRVTLQLGDSKELPYEENIFDKVFTSNTIYFWDEPNVYLT